MNTPDELRRKKLSMAYQPIAGFQHTPEDVTRFREAYAQPVYRADGKRQMGQVSPGATTTGNRSIYPLTAAYAQGRDNLNDSVDMAHTSEQFAALPPHQQEHVKTLRAFANDPTYVNATQLHEDHHLMMNRLQETHGLSMDQRKAVSNNMWNFLMHSTPDSHLVNKMTEAMHTQAKSDAEEKHATLISFLNSPSNRKHYGKIAGSSLENTARTAKKMYNNFRNLASNMNYLHMHDWMNNPEHVTPEYAKENSNLLKRIKGPAQTPKMPTYKSEDENDEG